MQRCRPAVPDETAAQCGAPTASAKIASNRGPVGPSESQPERSTSSTSSSSRSSIHGALRLIVVSVVRAQLRASCGTWSSQCDHRSLSPRTVSRYASWIASVTGPTPISWSSTERSGVTSAAVPHMNTSSAR